MVFAQHFIDLNNILINLIIASINRGRKSRKSQSQYFRVTRIGIISCNIITQSSIMAIKYLSYLQRQTDEGLNQNTRADTQRYLQDSQECQINYLQDNNKFLRVMQAINFTENKAKNSIISKILRNRLIEKDIKPQKYARSKFTISSFELSKNSKQKSEQKLKIIDDESQSMIKKISSFKNCSHHQPYQQKIQKKPLFPSLINHQANSHANFLKSTDERAKPQKKRDFFKIAREANIEKKKRRAINSTLLSKQQTHHLQQSGFDCRSISPMQCNQQKCQNIEKAVRIVTAPTQQKSSRYQDVSIFQFIYDGKNIEGMDMAKANAKLQKIWRKRSGTRKQGSYSSLCP